MTTWERRQWATLVGALVVVIVLLMLSVHTSAPARPSSIVIEVDNGPTVISTQVVPLR